MWPAVFANQTNHNQYQQFPVSSPEAPANAAAQVQVLNITNPPLGASASEPPHRQRRRLLRSLEGDERPRDLQDPNQPWALPPAPRDAAGQDSANGANVPLIPNMELVIRNLKPRNDYLVKVCKCAVFSCTCDVVSRGGMLKSRALLLPIHLLNSPTYRTRTALRRLCRGALARRRRLRLCPWGQRRR